MTGYWAVNSTADDGRLAICPPCVWAPATLAWLEIGFFWERPNKHSSGMEMESTTTSIRAVLVRWNDLTVHLVLCGLDLLKWKFGWMLSVWHSKHCWNWWITLVRTQMSHPERKRELIQSVAEVLYNLKLLFVDLISLIHVLIHYQEGSRILSLLCMCEHTGGSRA